MVVFWFTFWLIFCALFAVIVLTARYPMKRYTDETWDRVSCLHREGPYLDLVRRARRHHQAFHRSVFPCGGALAALIDKYPLCACYRFEGVEPIKTLVRKGWHRRGECPYPEGRLAAKVSDVEKSKSKEKS